MYVYISIYIYIYIHIYIYIYIIDGPSVKTPFVPTPSGSR